MDTLLGGLRQALRSLRRSPGFALSCVLLLATGIGASTALFSVVEGVLLRPLPYPRPERLVQLSQLSANGRPMQFSDPNFEDVQTQSRTVTALAQVSGEASVAVTGTDEPTFALLALASRDFFRAFAVQPVQGRLFAEEEQQAGGAPVVVVSHAFWKRYLGARPLPLPNTLTFEGRAYTVVGVMPASFDYPVGTQLWIPRELEARLPSRTAHNWRVVGRLADGVNLEAARAELSGIARALQARYGQDTRMHDIAVVPLQESLVGSVRPTLYVLLGAAAFLLLVAGANVTNLLLARAATRRRELAVHVALGAGPGALVRQFLTESLLLSLTGGALGAVLAAWSLRALLAFEPGHLPRVGEVAVNATALLFALGLSLLLALGLGLVTALRAARQSPWATLVQAGRTQAGGGRAERTRRALVVGQLALALVLLVGAALLGRSLMRLLSLDPGYRTEDIAVLSLVLPPAEDTAGRLRNVRLQEELLSRLGALPGVRAVGAVSNFPLEGSQGGDGTFIVLNRPDEVGNFEDFGRLANEPERTGSAEYRVASEGYFRALDIPLVRGRLFDARDTFEAPHVAVISESLAKARWPHEDPLGKLIQFGNMDGDLRPFTIVGVVGDVREQGLHEEPKPMFYGCSRQRLRASSRFHLAVHGPVGSAALVTSARPVLRELAPELPSRLRTVESLLGASLAPRRFSLLLLGAFGAVALLLSVAGLAAVVSYAVAQRTREFGIRFALGATTGDVLGMVLRQAALLAGIGVALGVLGAVGLSRVLAGLVYGVSTTDPLVLAAVALLLLGVALLAAWLPARRASRVDPMTVLRSEA
ncbi:ABC transporter permease [Pyxidicoccus fallax]|uniref:ABC transporter permease n=1 Tax=Pyxidicoccus fallax TaxID=394095 RepID=A0A848L9X5_9BACT|nr:ABC transporter permease [Pyxidicoccus fallax]NMO13655.1 ABC transporter permease [Pyxidicoccus fallax]NPC76857.1 ABC transporter permease [Pyxidicoccus fallax]